MIFFLLPAFMLTFKSPLSALFISLLRFGLKNGELHGISKEIFEEKHTPNECILKCIY